MKIARHVPLFFMLILLVLPAGAESRRLARAEALFGQGVYVEAARELEEHLRLFPDDFRAGVLLAGIYIRIKNYRAAVELCEKLENLRPGHKEVIALRKKAEAMREGVLAGEIAELEDILALEPEDHETRIVLAEKLADTGDYEKAVEHFAAAAEALDEPGIKLRYARFLARADDPERAARIYRDYLEIEDALFVRLELAGALIWAGKYAEASEELDAVLKEHPGHLEARLLLADMRLWSADYEGAELLYGEVLHDSPGNIRAEEGKRAVREARVRMEKVVAPTIEELKDALAEDPGDRAARLLLARLLSREGRFREASSHFERYLAEKPGEFMVRLEYAAALSARGLAAQAADEYREYLRLRPGDIAIRFELARVLKWAGDASGAQREFMNILETAPDNSEAKWEIAQLHMSAGRMREALEYYESILLTDPSSRAAEVMVAIIETSPRFLITKYREILSADPDDITARILLAKMLIEAGRHFEARAELALSLDMSPGHPEASALYRRADAELRRQLREDIARLREILREDPRDSRAQLELAGLLHASGNNEEALVRYEIYLGRHPGDYDARAEYARVLSWTPGRYGEAKREYEKLLMFDPENTDIRTEYARMMKWESSLWLQAEKEISAAISASPADAELRADLGDIYALRGKYSDALKAYGFALTLEPSDERAMRGIAEVRTLMRPRADASYSRMKDNEDYRETRQSAGFRFYAGQEYLVSPSVSRYSFRGDLSVVVDDDEEENSGGEEENGGERRETITVGSYLTQYNLAVESSMDLRTKVYAWLAYNDYSFFDNTLSYGFRGDYQADSKTLIALEYSKYDAIHEVKTISSLAQDIEADKISLELEYNPHYADELTPFLDKIRFIGYAAYAMYSDSNRYNAFRMRAFYPLKKSPEIEMGAGYRYLSYKDDSEYYWAPDSYHGPIWSIRANGRWRDHWSYRFEFETSFIQSVSSVQRGLSFSLYRNFTPDLTAGIVLTRSEVPREEERMYEHHSAQFELTYRF